VEEASEASHPQVHQEEEAHQEVPHQPEAALPLQEEEMAN